MKTHRWHKRPLTPVPEKPELEITSSPSAEQDETSVPGEALATPIDSEGTSFETHDTAALTAPIRIPSREQLAVNMVPSALVYQYDEYRSDEGHMSAGFYAFLGAFLAVLINWATSYPVPISTPSIVIEVLLPVIVVFLGIFAFVFNKRAKRLKSKIDELAGKKPG